MNTFKWILCLGACALGLQLHAAPMGSAFTYQGRLDANGAPAPNGLYDFRFSLHPSETSDSVLGVDLVLAVPVTNGQFTVQIDFSTTPFTTGNATWLELQVNTNAMIPLIPLEPRQRLTPTPQAIYAGTAASAVLASGVAIDAVGTAGLLNGAVTSAKITDGTITADDLSASLLGNTFWKLTGNAGTTAGVNFLGTTDNRALDLRVNGSRAFLLQPGFLGQHSVIGGPNQADVNLQGATVAGGYNGVIHRNAHYATLGGGSGNIIQIGARGSTISGGVSNWILTNATYATISGGRGNTVETNSSYGTIAGGADNRMARATGEFDFPYEPWYGVIGGGSDNVIAGPDYAVIGGGAGNLVGGGDNNFIDGDFGTIPGGRDNGVFGNYGFAAGRRAKAHHQGAFVWADSTDADFASTAANQFRVRAAGGMEVVGGIRAGIGGSLQSRVKFGTAAVGTGVGGVNTFTITFPGTFATPPKVFVTTRGNDNPDTFAISTRAVTTANFKINVLRMDLAGGWGQNLQVDWYAVE